MAARHLFADSLTGRSCFFTSLQLKDMVTIDIAFFPHIFDSIFEASDHNALIRLRQTCRALRSRIDDEWGHLAWLVKDDRPYAAVNRRGLIIPCDSPCLRLTTVLDICHADDWCDVNEVPSCCRPEVIRIFCLGIIPLTTCTKTIIILDQECGDIAGYYMEPPPDPQFSINIIYKLDCMVWEGSEGRCPPFFSYVGRMKRSADVYLLLSGCNPTGDCVKDLCYFMMESLTGYKSGVREGEAPLGYEHNFYFVDVPSWFDTSITDLPEDDSERLDRILTTPSTFYAHMLAEAGYEEGLEDGSEAEYARHWPRLVVLERVFKQVHCISREQMRKRVGDKAFDLTFAPPMRTNV